MYFVLCTVVNTIICATPSVHYLIGSVQSNIFIIDCASSEPYENLSISLSYYSLLEDTARYAGKKNSLLCCFGPFFVCNFWCPVVTLVTFSSNLSNFEMNNKKKIQKKVKKNPINFQISKNQKKVKKKSKKSKK